MSLKTPQSAPLYPANRSHIKSVAVPLAVTGLATAVIVGGAALLREPLICAHFNRATLYTPEDQDYSANPLLMMACGTKEQKAHYKAERLPSGLAARSSDWERPKYFNLPEEERLLSRIDPYDGPIIDLVEKPMDHIPLPDENKENQDTIAEIAETTLVPDTPLQIEETDSIDSSEGSDSLEEHTPQL